jgi:nucleoside-diphosphate-sugar epimerase
MRILITGGAGCLGSNLIEHWLPLGHQIAVIDNFATGKRELVPNIQGLTVFEGSVADEGLVEQVFRSFRPEVVIHAAASYKDPDDWQQDSATNVVGSAIVAKVAKNQGVRRVVNFQTSLCYGRPLQVPVPRFHALAPFTSYGITKTAGEQLMMLSSVSTVSLRLANVSGPRLAIGPIPTFYKRLKAGQGCFCTDSSRDFLDMEDFLHFMDLAIKESAPTGVFNLGTGEAHSVKEIYDIVREHVGLPPDSVRVEPVGADDVPVMMLDSSETKAAFGWKARHSFQETIKRQLAWYDEHGVTDVFSHLKEPTAKAV